LSLKPEARALRLDVAVEGIGKAKKSKILTLTIHKVANMMEIEVEKLKPKKIKEINKLYKDTFMSLCKWGKKPLTDGKGQLLHIHYRYLHKALLGKLVY